MSNHEKPVWTKPLDCCAVQKEYHRELIIEGIPDQKRKKVSLMFNDITGTDSYYKIPIGKATPSPKGESSPNDLILVPLIPMLYTTYDQDKTTVIPVRPGWLYVYLNGYLWRELEVFRGSYMRDVNLHTHQGEDRRIATVEQDTRIVLPHVVDGVEQDIEVCFCEVQLSWARLNELGGLNPEDPRLKDDTELADPASSEYAATSRTDRMLKITNLGEYGNGFESSDIEQNIISIQAIKHRRHKSLHLKSKLGVLCIPDPLGVSRNLALAHEFAWGELYALVNSLRTAIQPKPTTLYSVYHPKSISEPTEHQKEIAAQFDVYSLLYRLAFGTPDGIEKMGENMNKALFTTYLAVDKRKTLRDEITAARKKLVDFLNTDGYQRSLADFINNTPERTIEGKGWVALTLQMIDTNIHALDAHLDLAEDIKSTLNLTDPGVEYLKKTSTTQNHAGALLLTPAKVSLSLNSKLPTVASDEKLNALMSDPATPITGKLFAALSNKNMAIVSKTTAITAALIDSFADMTVQNRDELVQLTKKINTIEVPGFEKFKVSEQVYAQKSLPEGYKEISSKKFKLTSEKSPALVTFPTSKSVAFVSGDYGLILKGRSVQVMPVTITTEEVFVKQIVQFEVPSKANRAVLAREIKSSKLYGKGFGSFLVLLEIINIKSAINQLNKMKTTNQMLKANINWVGSGFGAGATLAYLTELWAKGAGRVALKETSALAGKMLGKMALIPSAFLSGWDAVDNYLEKDYDAMGAYAGAAFATAGMLFLSGIIVPILAVVVLSFLIAAWLLEDDPLERYSKNGPMKSDVTVATGETVWEQISNSAKSTNIDPKYIKWQSWHLIRKELFDYLQAFEIKMNVERDKIELNADLNNDGKISWSESVVAKKTSNWIAKTVDVTIVPRDFNPFLGELEFYCRCYPLGFEKSTGKELVLKAMHTEVNDSTNKVKHIILSFAFEKDFKPAGDIMFCARIRSSKETKNYIPVTSEAGEDRFSAFKTSAMIYAANDLRHGNRTNNIGTLSDLETLKYWKGIQGSIVGIR